MNTQSAVILDYLLTVGPLTARKASSDLNIDRLAARVHELKEAGAQIKSQMCYKRDSNGKIEKKWKEYWI